MSLAQLAIFAVATIQAIADAVRDAAEGKVTTEEAHARIVSLHAKLASNDAAADAALVARFPPEK